MLRKFNTLTFWIELGIAVVVWLLAFLAVKHYWTKQEYQMKSDYLRIPTNNAMVVLGLLIPILVALASYFYTKAPEASYSSLLSAIVILFIVLLIAIWETHAVLEVASATDVVTIKIPSDRSLIVGLVVIYSFLVLGLFYFAIFFLFEISPSSISKGEPHGTRPSFNLAKSRASISQSRDEILKEWGEPTTSAQDKTKLEYQSDKSTVVLLFDGDGKVKEIIETRSNP